MLPIRTIQDVDVLEIGLLFYLMARYYGHDDGQKLLCCKIFVGAVPYP